MKKIFVVLLAFALLFSTVAVTAASQNLGVQSASPDASAAVEPTGTGAIPDTVVVWEGTINREYTTKNTLALINNDVIDAAIQADIAANGLALGYELISPDSYYISGPSNYATWGFYQETPEYAENWSDRESSLNYATFTNTSWLKEMNGEVRLCLYSDNSGDTAYVGSLKLIAYRNTPFIPTTKATTTTSSITQATSQSTDETTNTTSQSTDETTNTTKQSVPDTVVVWEGTVDREYTTKNTLALINNDVIDAAIQADIAANGLALGYELISPDSYYISGPSNYATWGFYQETPEYAENWSDRESSLNYATFTNTSWLKEMNGEVRLCLYSDDSGDTAYVGSLKLIAYRNAPFIPTGIYTTTAKSQKPTTQPTTQPTTPRTLPTTLPNSEITPISHALKSNEVCVYSGVVNQVVLPQFIGDEYGYVGILDTGLSSDGKTDNLMAAIRDDIVKNGPADKYTLYVDVGEYLHKDKDFFWHFRTLDDLTGLPGYDMDGTIYEQSWTDPEKSESGSTLGFSTMNLENWRLALGLRKDEYAYVKSIMFVAARGEETDVTTRTTSGKEDAVWQIGNLSTEHDKVIEVPIDLVKNASGIWSFENTLQYDPTMLSFQGISINADFRQKGLIATGYEKDGVITLTGSAALFQTPCTATGTVATIQFKTVGPRGKFTAITGESIVRNTSNYSKTVDTFVIDGGVDIIDPTGGYDGPLAIDIGNVKTDIGSTVSVPIIISGNPGFCNAEFSLNFDDEQLTFESVEWGSDFDAYFDKENCRNAKLTDEGVLTFSVLGLQKDKNCYANGTLATVTFKVSDTARSGKYFLIGNAGRSGNLTVDGQRVSLDINDGAVRVRAEFPETASAETSGREGDTVFVPVVLNCETAVFSLNVDIKFNPAALFFLDAMIPDDPDFHATMSEDGTTLLISSSNPDKPLQGNIATIMQFQIAKGAGKGRQSVNAAVNEQSVISMGSINQSLLAASGGTVNVVEDVETLGDANGDGSVNMKDVLMLRKYIANLTSDLDLTSADVNRDGTVNMKDVLLLRKFLAGLIETLG